MKIIFHFRGGKDGGRILYVFILYLIKGCLPLSLRAKQQPSSQSFINKYTERASKRERMQALYFSALLNFLCTHKGCLATLKQARNLGESALAGVINVINSGTESARGLVKWLRPERRGRGHRAIDVAQALLNLWGPLRTRKWEREQEMMCRLCVRSNKSTSRLETCTCRATWAFWDKMPSDDGAKDPMQTN